MFGKAYAQMFTGSMFGKDAVIFAVWTYIIANMQPPSRRDHECYCEVNPALLAATFSTPIDEIDAALLDLESPDPKSRNKRDEGRRIVLAGDGERTLGPRQYRVVNGATYRAMRDEEERREQNRVNKNAERQRKKATHRQPMSADVINVSQSQPKSAHGEGEVEVDVDVDGEERVKGERPERKRSAFPLSSDFQPDGKSKAGTHPLSRKERDALFGEVWELVPRKEGKAAARKTFDADVKTIADVDRYRLGIAGYQRKIADERIAPRFVLKGSTLFNNIDDFVSWQPVAQPPSVFDKYKNFRSTLDFDKLLADDDDDGSAPSAFDQLDRFRPKDEDVEGDAGNET